MRWGEAWSSILGDSEDAIHFLEVKETSYGLRVRFSPQIGYGERWWGIYLDGVLQERVYVSEGETIKRLIPDADGTCVRIEDLSDYGTVDAYNPQFVAEEECGSSTKFTVEWKSTPVQSIIGDRQFLSNPNLTGLERFTNVAPYGSDWTFGVLDAAVLDDGTENPRLVLFAGQVPVSSGVYNPTDSTFTCTELNMSNVNGTVEYTPDSFGGSIYQGTDCRILVRWPKWWRIFWQDYPFGSTGIDPDAYNARITDFCQRRLRYRSPALPAGEYFVALLGEDSDGLTDTATSSTGEVTLNSVPLRPYGLQFVSGSHTDLMVSFLCPDQDGVVYDVYASDVIDGPVNLRTTVSAGLVPDSAGLIYANLLPIAPRLYVTDNNSVGYVQNWFGKVRVIARARRLSDDVTDGNTEELVIQLNVDGEALELPPNETQLESKTIDVRTLTVRGSYFNVEEQSVATELRLFVWPVTSNIDLSTPVATVALSQGAVVQYADLTYELPTTTDNWRIAVCAATALGTLGPARYDEINITQPPLDAAQLRIFAT